MHYNHSKKYLEHVELFMNAEEFNKNSTSMLAYIN